ncbi:MAG TPA: MGMT family protein [Armatimonadota bacterium]|nr:MGMT family protein [Armatimonadota bacterium]
MITCGTFDMPWGRISVEISEYGLQRVHLDAPVGVRLTGIWAEAFAAYVEGRDIFATLPVDVRQLSPFTQQVLMACRAIPVGHVMSYAQLAMMVGRPRAARAVGSALAHNPVPIVIPCHRVVGTGGRLTGFLGGLALKRRLLIYEGCRFIGDSVDTR